MQGEPGQKGEMGPKYRAWIKKWSRLLDAEIMKATTASHPVPIVRDGQFLGLVAATDQAKAEVFNKLKRRKP
jgi:hypothetical protein